MSLLYMSLMNSGCFLKTFLWEVFVSVYVSATRLSNNFYSHVAPAHDYNKCKSVRLQIIWLVSQTGKVLTGEPDGNNVLVTRTQFCTLLIFSRLRN